MSVQYVVPPGDAITAFALGPLDSWPFHGPVTRGVDNLSYDFVNGFTDVGDLPCRVATWEEIRSRATPPLERPDAVGVHLPGASRRLDFSGFWHVPHRLRRWARTRLIPPQTGTYKLGLTTCGGVNIWVDGQHVAAFEPFDRNTPHQTEIALPLRAEGSDVDVLLEDMAERDTEFFAAFEWRGQASVTVEIDSDAEEDVLNALRDMARDLHPAKSVFTQSDHLILSLSRPSDTPVELRARVGQSVHLSHLPPLMDRSVRLEPGQTTLDLGPLEHMPDGYHPLDLEISAGPAQVHRQIAFASMAELAPQKLPETLSGRKAMALRQAALRGEPRIGRVLATVACGMPLDAEALAILNDTLDGIAARRDCSDFTMPPLLWVWADGQAALPQDTRDAIRTAILGYRYWTDEPGNDAMWFWSENHALCFHVSQYLAGRLFPDDTFSNSGLTGAQQASLGAGRLEKWFDSIEAHGFAEWNSAAYYPIDFIGLMALFHLGAGRIKTRARGLLDRLFTMIALHSIGGVSAGSQGRAYDKELRAGPLTELAPFAAVAFGTGWLNNGVASLPMFCASDYEPPANLSGYVRPAEGTAQEARYVQGFGKAGQLALYKTAQVQMSASIDGTPGQAGHQQHMLDVQFADHPFARFWINHPGNDDPWSHARPSYWAGNGVMPRVGMYRNAALFLSDVPDTALPFTHAYAPVAQFDDHAAGADWIAFRSAKGAVLAKATGPITAITEGPTAWKEFRLTARCGGWLVLACDLTHRSWDDLILCAETITLTLDSSLRALTCQVPGAPELRLDYASGLFVDGAACHFPNASSTPVVTRATPYF